MTVNAVMGEAQAGSYATSRRGGVAEDAEFIVAKVRAGVPVSQIARMLHRNVEDVRAAAEAFACLEYQPPKSKEQPTAPLPPPKADFDPKSRVKRARTPPLWARQIIDRICKEHGLTLEQLHSNTAKAHVAHPRQQVYYELYATNRCSLSMIGAWFNKDHSTILHGIRRHARRAGLPLPEFARMHIDARIHANGNTPEREAA